MKTFADKFLELMIKYNIIEKGEITFKDGSALIMTSIQDEITYEISTSIDVEASLSDYWRT